jgi:uncharacterized protein YajQ (UPF0234 family)
MESLSGWALTAEAVSLYGDRIAAIRDLPIAVGREGFEPSKATPADLQSAPFGRSGTDPGTRFDCGVGPHRPSRAAAGPGERIAMIRTPHRRSRGRYPARMASFDVVSEVDSQEVRNGVDQAQREVSNRFDFKNTNSTIDQNDMVLTLSTVSEDRLKALRTVLEEKLVKRGVSLKGVEYGDVQEASHDTVRQIVTIAVGISADKAKQINKLVKEKGAKGVSSSNQGDSIRVNAKKRDALQDVIAMLKAEDLGIPLQFNNFRD